LSRSFRIAFARHCFGKLNMTRSGHLLRIDNSAGCGMKAAADMVLMCLMMF
jgi:hypothetical protein